MNAVALDVVPGAIYYLVTLERGHGLRGYAHRIAGSGYDLDEHERSFFFGNQIDLSERTFIVSEKDLIASRLQILKRELLTQNTERLRWAFHN